MFKKKVKQPDPFPPAMPFQGAAAWIMLHLEVDPVAFWEDQAKKHRRNARVWYIAGSLFILSAILQVVGIILRADGL